MSDIMRNTEDYDNISDAVRRFCAERLYECEKALRPWIDGSFGDITPGHVNGYVSILRELGRLYQTHKPPRQDDSMLPKAQVEQMLAAAQLEAEARIEAAVLEAEQRVRVELAASSAKSIESAKTTALTKLQMLRERAQG